MVGGGPSASRIERAMRVDELASRPLHHLRRLALVLVSFTVQRRRVGVVVKSTVASREPRIGFFVHSSPARLAGVLAPRAHQAWAASGARDDRVDG